ncbi:AimR family lysis-lysogeny pheromone receptor [Ornithinibacillus halotolerans]|nr:AimR family lysis-lysogeny pheromone receptor [Ornithinibacillus halotolerans]
MVERTELQEMNNSDIGLIPEYMTDITDKIELTMEQVMLLVSQEHSEQEALDLIRKYCLQSTSVDVQKKGLEFLYMNGFYQDLEILIAKNRESLFDANRKWAEVYQIMLDRRKRKYPMWELRRRLGNIQSPDPELTCLIELSIVDTYNSELEFGMIGNFLEKQQQLFDQIEDNFILTSFNLRLYQKLFMYYWKRNELIMARKYAFRALNQTNSPHTKVGLNINLSLTYTFETYYQAMYHLKEALKISKANNMTKMIHSIEQRNMPFIAAHFKRTTGVSSTDISEQAHIEIARGNNEKAITLLEDIYHTSPFRMYYMGLAKQDKNILSESCSMFVERSDYFFSRLPMNAIKNL